MKDLGNDFQNFDAICACKRILCTLTFRGSFQTECFLQSQCVFRYIYYYLYTNHALYHHFDTMLSPKYRGVFKEEAIR